MASETENWKDSRLKIPDRCPMTRITSRGAAVYKAIKILNLVETLIAKYSKGGVRESHLRSFSFLYANLDYLSTIFCSFYFRTFPEPTLINPEQFLRGFNTDAPARRQENQYWMNSRGSGGGEISPVDGERHPNHPVDVIRIHGKRNRFQN